MTDRGAARLRLGHRSRTWARTTRSFRPRSTFHWCTMLPTRHLTANRSPTAGMPCRPRSRRRNHRGTGTTTTRLWLRMCDKTASLRRIALCPSNVVGPPRSRSVETGQTRPIHSYPSYPFLRPNPPQRARRLFRFLSLLRVSWARSSSRRCSRLKSKYPKANGNSTARC
ncbi:hypothetical protein RSOL_345630 [Rhizoctonia solani AG-3 Rhs1AP]|uniref:Uncharacterized protein n=1 Tax=Rhizoctonia solani AG-3 Rhs1AP TaxID=1086054 RepID=X8J8W6_9AGAM|nr:hypothetical protein RSOL_345630 [Rhizoctonia solani AG-3 Rhs1AP]